MQGEQQDKLDVGTYFKANTPMKSLQVSTLVWRAMMVLMVTLALAAIYMNATAGTKRVKSITVNVATEQSNVSVSVKSSRSCELQFYVFDMGGQLVKQYSIKAPSSSMINSLSKGTYMYDVFHDDKKIKSGKIELK
jgi:hypothetical protein